MDVLKFHAVLDDVVETTLPDVGPIKVTTRKLGSSYYQFDITTTRDRFSEVEHVLNDHCMLHIDEIPVVATITDENEQ
ncbi:hypothetical protein [Furfurilactobacillus entadae]|uniref:hypothetical protein n=1 Tax=Furfurilactobacillus entadae TaxID=2922307 RepID=UPI0035E7522F